MNAKLTLRLDRDVIERAKAYSREVGKPVSRLVEEYFEIVTSRRGAESSCTPRVQRLRGILAGSLLDEQDYRDYLETKNG